MPDQDEGVEMVERCAGGHGQFWRSVFDDLRRATQTKEGER